MGKKLVTNPQYNKNLAIKTTKLETMQTKQQWTEKLDLVSCGHALVLALYIVALFVWDGQHLDVLDCSLISLAGSGGRLPGVEIFNFMLFHGSLVLDPIVSGTNREDLA